MSKPGIASNELRFLKGSMKTVVVIGASKNPDRYAFKAMQRLQAQGYKAVPVNPNRGINLPLDGQD